MELLTTMHVLTSFEKIAAPKPKLELFAFSIPS